MRKIIMLHGKEYELEERANGECPFVDRRFIPDITFNVPVVWNGSTGEYIFYKHFDGIDTTYNCQFCVLCGRVRDVFQCLNTGEWHECGYYRNRQRDVQIVE